MPSPLTIWGPKPYQDGIPIPYYRYKCKAGLVVPEVKSDDLTKFRAKVEHTCKIHIDHTDEDHKCICGVEWKNHSKKEKANA